MQQQSHEVDSDDRLLELCPSVIATRIQVIPPEVWLLKEAELETKASVHDNERKLRVAFQMEHERAIRTGDIIVLFNVYKNIVTKSYFYNYVITNSYKLAYIIKPFPEYEMQLEEMLQLGLDERRKILKQPLKDKEGKFDHKLAALKEAITKNLEERRRGSITQKLQVDQKNLNLSITKDVTQQPPLQMEAIDARLRELEGGEAIAISYEESSDGTREV
jgi:hypothetical protein